MEPFRYEEKYIAWMGLGMGACCVGYDEDRDQCMEIG